jgi:hypothetical protein
MNKLIEILMNNFNLSIDAIIELFTSGCLSSLITASTTSTLYEAEMNSTLKDNNYDDAMGTFGVTTLSGAFTSLTIASNAHEMKSELQAINDTTLYIESLDIQQLDELINTLSISFEEDELTRKLIKE